MNDGLGRDTAQKEENPEKMIYMRGATRQKKGPSSNRITEMGKGRRRTKKKRL